MPVVNDNSIESNDKKYMEARCITGPGLANFIFEAGIYMDTQRDLSSVSKKITFYKYRQYRRFCNVLP